MFGTPAKVGYHQVAPSGATRFWLAVAQPESPGALAMLDMAAIMMFALAIAVALSSLTITVAEDNKQKFAAQSEKYGKEIETLKMILKTRLDKLGPRS